MRPRIFVDAAFETGATIALPQAASRHAQVLRLQPGQSIDVFNGSDGIDWSAQIERIGRAAVEVSLGQPQRVDRELPLAVTIAVGMPTNDRMDALVEKAGELGARAIQPLLCERSVLRLSGERAEARRRHWQGVAVAASEQCGRSRVAEVLPVQSLLGWLAGWVVNDRQRRRDDAASAVAHRVVLSFAGDALTPARVLGDTCVKAIAFGDAAAKAKASASAMAINGEATQRTVINSVADPTAAESTAAEATAPDSAAASIVILSGPEGGLTRDEEEAAVRNGFVRVGLGPRVLRADTAPLALLAWLGIGTTGGAR